MPLPCPIFALVNTKFCPELALLVPLVLALVPLPEVVPDVVPAALPEVVPAVVPEAVPAVVPEVLLLPASR